MLSIYEKAFMSKIEFILGITIPALYTKKNLENLRTNWYNNK